MKIYKRKTSVLTSLTFVVLAILFYVNAFEAYHKLMAVLFLIFSILALTHKSGIEFSKNLGMRRFNTVLGYSFGRWEKLPDIKHLAVVRAKQHKYRMAGGYFDQVQSNKIIYQFNMVFENGTYKKLMSAKETKAMESATRLGKYLGIRIFDYRTHNKKWIDPN